MSTITILKGKGTPRNNFKRSLLNRIPNYKITLLGPSMISYLYNEKYSSENTLVLVEMTSSIDICKLIEYYSDTNVKIGLILSKADEMQITSLLELSVDGYFLVDMEIDEIISGINLIEKGYTYVHPALTTVFHREFLKLSNSVPHRPEGLLTNREWEVLEEISRGHSNDTIAANLSISVRTVKNHVTSLFRKLNVNDRTNAMLLAMKRGYLFCDLVDEV